MKYIAIVPLVLCSGLANAAPIHHCSADAIKQAGELLNFHNGPDGRIEINKNVKVLSPIKNPANKTQSFDVLEVWGYIYKGQYRMHFIYATKPDDCLLMGQEILEYASL